MVTDSELRLAAYIALGLLVLFIFAAGCIILRSRKQQEMAETPMTEQGLKQYDYLPSGMAVMMAWSEAGDNPRWHQKMQDEVRQNMPVLARALDRMVETNS